MARPPAAALHLDPDQRAALTARARNDKLPNRQAVRARIVLLASQGVNSAQIADELKCSEPTVRLWRRRFESAGLHGIEREAPGRGRPRTYDDSAVRKVLSLTQGRPPSGKARWSSRAVAAQAGVSPSTVQRIWRKFHAKPGSAISKPDSDAERRPPATDLVRLGGVAMSSAEAFNRRLLRARDAMDRAYALPLDVAALARVASLSETHFIRSFRVAFGETPHRYLQRRRVERSMFLLRETERSVTDICFSVGFTSLGTFSRTFREIVGEPPSTYRLGHEPLLPPNCFQMAAMRPVAAVIDAVRSGSFGEASVTTAP